MIEGFDRESIMAALRSVLPHGDQKAALHEPRFNGNEWAYVNECLDTGWVSSVGKFVDRFETELAAFTGARQAIAVVNGTAALHICLKLAGVRRDDEVLIPTLTFVATANAVSYCEAIPHFVDSEISTLGMDAAKLDEYLSDIAEVREGQCLNKKTGRRIAAVVPMHTFGHPVNLDALLEVCDKFSIPLVEDAAESLGSFYRSKHTGTIGKISALSFNGNKIITTGGGGAILTNDETLGRLAKHITTTAKIPHAWQMSHDMIGYNYRMPNLNAALGCAQLEQLPHFLEKKRSLANRYEQAFRSLPGVSFVKEPPETKSNYWLNAILLDEACSEARDSILDMTNAAGLQTRPTWTLMHQLTMFESCPKMDLSVAEGIAGRLINIPSGVIIGEGVEAA